MNAPSLFAPPFPVVVRGGAGGTQPCPFPPCNEFSLSLMPVPARPQEPAPMLHGVNGEAGHKVPHSAVNAWVTLVKIPVV